jgi:hypothetical protein
MGRSRSLSIQHAARITPLLPVASLAFAITACGASAQPPAPSALRSTSPAVVDVAPPPSGPASDSGSSAQASAKQNAQNDEELVHYLNARQKPVTASLSFAIRDASGIPHKDLMQALESSAQDDACFRDAVSRHESGTLEFTITIDRKGIAKSVKLSRTDGAEGPLSKCLEGALKKIAWLTPTDKAGAQATLSWTLSE